MLPQILPRPRLLRPPSSAPGGRSSRRGGAGHPGRFPPGPRARPGRHGDRLRGRAGLAEPARGPQGAGDPARRRLEGRWPRFRIEAQVAALLNHPHIVPIFAVGCDQGCTTTRCSSSRGSLAERLREARREVAEARASLPARRRGWPSRPPRRSSTPTRLGILHRDIKPANLLLDPRGHLWVTDFGLARLQGASRPDRSPATCSGPLRYMSPEQAAGGRVLDPRTDVYSLGATLYELLTVAPAFDGPDRQELLRRISQVEPVPAAEDRPGDPPGPRDDRAEGAWPRSPATATPRRGSWPTTWAGSSRTGRSRARRPGLAEKLSRWSRRHHRGVVAGGIGLLLASLLLAGGAAFLWNEQARTKAALATAEEARRHERRGAPVHVRRLRPGRLEGTGEGRRAGLRPERAGPGLLPQGPGLLRADRRAISRRPRDAPDRRRGRAPGRLHPDDPPGRGRRGPLSPFHRLI